MAKAHNGIMSWNSCLLHNLPLLLRQRTVSGKLKSWRGQQIMCTWDRDFFSWPMLLNQRVTSKNGLWKRGTRRSHSHLHTNTATLMAGYPLNVVWLEKSMAHGVITTWVWGSTTYRPQDIGAKTSGKKETSSWNEVPSGCFTWDSDLERKKVKF